MGWRFYGLARGHLGHAGQRATAAGPSIAADFVYVALRREPRTGACHRMPGGLRRAPARTANSVSFGYARDEFAGICRAGLIIRHVGKSSHQ